MTTTEHERELAAERQRRRRARLASEQQTNGSLKIGTSPLYDEDLDGDDEDSSDLDGAADAGGVPPPPPASTSGKRTYTLTYLPASEDPSETVWNRITFKANLPVELSLDNPKHGYMVPIPEYSTHPMTGQRMSNHVEKWVPMLDIVKDSWCWSIDGKPPTHKRIIITKKVAPAGAEWLGTNRDELIQAEMGAHRAIDPSQQDW